ncbi:MAG: hypothetical protein KIT43_13840 [Bauldia sp.]|nr:hypothetical protein [Bauldia sp.]MCW5716601.1 hypothetical protein [Bauldia sp.]
MTVVLERYDNRISIGHVIVFLVIAVALGAYLAFVTGPHLREAIDAGVATIVETPAEGAAAIEEGVEEERGVTLLDMRFTGFEHEDVDNLKAALTDEDVSYYTGNHLVADLFFAPAFFLAFSCLFIFLTKPGRRFAVPLPEGVRLVVLSLGLAAFVADVGENICLWIIMGSEDPANGLLFLGATLTGIKWLAYSAAAAAILATVVLAVLRGLGGGNSAPARPAGARH